MKFKKPSLPTKKKRQKVAEQKLTPGVLAIWGSPGCGKTTAAIKIAAHIASQKHNVILMLCDQNVPMMAAIAPPSEMECQRSLQSVLAATHITNHLVENNLVTLHHNNYLTFLGFQRGENEQSCPVFDALQVKELILSLSETATFVVIDCGSHIAYDILSAVSLPQADHILWLMSCDLKSIGFFTSQLPLFSQLGVDPEREYHIPSNVEPGQPLEVLGSTVFPLPHSNELHTQFLSGNLLKPLNLKESLAYRRSIGSIIKEVFGL